MLLRPKLLGLAFLMCGLCAHGAIAGEWRYCLAVSSGTHTVYMSPAFSAVESRETDESDFGRALDRAAVQHDAVQCPLGNAQSIASMKAHAIKFNQESGNKIVQLNWRP